MEIKGVTVTLWACEPVSVRSDNILSAFEKTSRNRIGWKEWSSVVE